VVNAAGDQVTSVKTGGALANDTYTVTLRSAANGFHEGANLLDGNADGTVGDNYVTTFTRSAAANSITASIPDFARGPGQVVDVWNAAGQAAFAGIPVLLSTGLGVGSVEFTVHYDPALLVIDTVKLGPSVAADAALAFSFPSPGTLNISVYTGSQLATTAGSLPLVSLMRTNAQNPNQPLAPQVPTTAAYGGKHVLDIQGLYIYDNTLLANELPAVADDGVHVAAYAGELSGNGAYNSPDASFAQQFILNQATFGLAAYPLVDPVIMADINANGSVQANDVGQIQRLILNLGSPFVPGSPAPMMGGDGLGGSLALPEGALEALWGSLAGGASDTAVDAALDEEEGEWWLAYFAEGPSSHGA
jgi:hypothetical protein